MDNIVLFERSMKDRRLVAHCSDGKVYLPGSGYDIREGLVEVVGAKTKGKGNGTYRFVYGDNIAPHRIGSAEDLMHLYPMNDVYMTAAGIPFVIKDPDSSVGTFLVDEGEVEANTNIFAKSRNSYYTVVHFSEQQRAEALRQQMRKGTKEELMTACVRTMPSGEYKVYVLGEALITTERDKEVHYYCLDRSAMPMEITEKVFNALSRGMKKEDMTKEVLDFVIGHDIALCRYKTGIVRFIGHYGSWMKERIFLSSKDFTMKAYDENRAALETSRINYRAAVTAFYKTVSSNNYEKASEWVSDRKFALFGKA